MIVRQIELREANNFIVTFHRHHDKVQGHRFSLGCFIEDELVGIAVCGRPVSRNINKSEVLEITRLCTKGNEKNVASKLLGACARIAKEFGYKHIITYILESESGISLIAAGYRIEKKCIGHSSWDRPKRRRQTINEDLFGTTKKYPESNKQRWSKSL